MAYLLTVSKTAPKSDILVLVVTFVLTVLFDLVVAIEIGMILACLLFIKRMSEETKAESWVYTDDDTVAVNENLRKLPAEIRVYEVSGPLFFGASDAIEHIVVEESAKCLVLRMRAVPALDSTAMNALTALTKTCESKGVTIVFSHVNEQPMKVMKRPDLLLLQVKRISARISLLHWKEQKRSLNKAVHNRKIHKKKSRKAVVIRCHSSFLAFIISGMTIKIHTIGSAIIMPQYWKMRARRKAQITFPMSSIILENTGVMWSPIP